MRLVITKRGQKRIASNRKYLEDNFYLETGSTTACKSA